jgi:hypothetical protein
LSRGHLGCPAYDVDQLLDPFTSIFADKTLSCRDSFYGQPQNATAMLKSTTCVTMVGEGFVDYDIRDMGKGLLKHPKEKPLPGPGQLLVLLLGNMASGFPNLMTPTSGQLTGTMGSMYLTTPASTYPRSPVTPGRMGPPSTQRRGVTSATVTFLKRRSPSVAS